MRPVDDALRDAGQALLDAVTKANAYGLAAVHIGLVEPVVVISVANDTAIRDYRLLFNPQITALSAERLSGPEGSVSLPGIEIPVDRAAGLKFTFDTQDGERQSLSLDGFAARVAQHEIDQMNGVFFLDRVSRTKRETALRKFAKSQRR